MLFISWGATKQFQVIQINKAKFSHFCKRRINALVHLDEQSCLPSLAETNNSISLYGLPFDIVVCS